MSESRCVHDDFGNEIPLLDAHGNLSLQVILLYTSDKLTAEDRKIVDELVATDEMSRDALEGYALTGNPAKTRHDLNELNSAIQQRTGAKPAVPIVPVHSSDTFNYRKLAAAIALLVVVGGGTLLLTRLFSDNKMAVNTTQVNHAESEHQPTTRNEQTQTRENEESDNVGHDTYSDSEDVQEDEAQDETPPSVTKKLRTEPTELAKNEKPSTVQQPGPTPRSKETTASDLSAKVQKGAAETTKPMELTQAAADIDLETEQMQDELLIAEEETEPQMARTETMTGARQQAKMENQAAQAVPIAIESTSKEEAANAAANSGARFPGGDIAMYKFIEKRKNYTPAMRNQGMKGAVTITFDVEPDGRISNARVKTGVNGLLNEDALRVVRSMPNWEPAKENGTPVRSTRSVVIKYGD